VFSSVALEVSGEELAPMTSSIHYVKGALSPRIISRLPTTWIHHHVWFVSNASSEKFDVTKVPLAQPVKMRVAIAIPCNVHVFPVERVLRLEVKTRCSRLAFHG
jgi:hypothetical protein